MSGGIVQDPARARLASPPCRRKEENDPHMAVKGERKGAGERPLKTGISEGHAQFVPIGDLVTMPACSADSA